MVSRGYKYRLVVLLDDSRNQASQQLWASILPTNPSFEMYLNGENDYNIPHLKKQVGRRASNEIKTIFCVRGSLGKAQNFFNSA